MALQRFHAAPSSVTKSSFPVSGSRKWRNRRSLGSDLPESTGTSYLAGELRGWKEQKAMCLGRMRCRDGDTVAESGLQYRLHEAYF